MVIKVINFIVLMLGAASRVSPLRALFWHIAKVSGIVDMAGDLDPSPSYWQQPTLLAIYTAGLAREISKKDAILSWFGESPNTFDPKFPNLLYNTVWCLCWTTCFGHIRGLVYYVFNVSPHPKFALFQDLFCLLCPVITYNMYWKGATIIQGVGAAILVINAVLWTTPPITSSQSCVYEINKLICARAAAKSHCGEEIQSTQSLT